MKSFLSILIILLFQNAQLVFSQSDNYGFPFIRNYSPKEYVGSNQNWSIIQDKKGTIYIGNSPSVLSLEGDGKKWKATSVINSSATRSMAIDPLTGIIYVGVNNDFGYLSVGKKGQLVYKSLRNIIPNDVEDFGEVWYTFVTKDGIYFISNYLIVRIKNGRYKIWENDNGAFHTAFNIGGKIIIRQRQEGLMVIEGDNIIPINNSELFTDNRVDFILPYKKGSYLLGSRTLGLFEANFNFIDSKKSYCNLKKIKTNLDDILLSKEITRAIQLSNGDYAIGTIKGGAIIVDTNLAILSKIDDKIGLQDLTVNELYEDSQNNLWLALNIGNSCVEINSPFRTIIAQNGLKGITKALVRFNDEIYFATSQGLFVFKHDTKQIVQVLDKPVDCWDAISFEYSNNDKSLIVGTKEGVFEILNGTQRKIYNLDKSVYKVVQSKKFKNTLYLGLYNGFDVIQNINGNWISLGMVKNVEGEILDIDEDEGGNLWLCTQINGLYYLENKFLIGSRPNFTVHAYDTSNGLPSNDDNSIHQLNGKFILNTSEKQLFTITKSTTNKESNFIFEKRILIDSNFYNNTRYIIKLNVDEQQNVWMQTFFGDSIVLDNGVALKMSNGKYNWYNKPFKRLPQSQFLAILAEPNGVTWFTVNDGGVISYNSKIKYKFNTQFKAKISYLISSKDTLFHGEFSTVTTDLLTKKKIIVPSNIQSADSVLELEYEKNNLTFQFAASSFITSENNKFSFYLEGNDKSWSDWNIKTEKDYTNLSEGEYTFHLKSQDVYGNVSLETTYKLIILPPWYRTIWAKIIYLILSLAALYLIVYLYTKNLQNTINEKTSEIRLQSRVIENKNKEITDSIFYAKKIQEAIMPSAAFITELFSESFVLFKPKDIVSGDFYWATQKGNKTLIAAADCTGHGVPGAFMSMLGNDNLNEVVIDRNIVQPNEILDGARLGIIKALKQKGESGENKDGMDIALISFDKETLELNYSGANNPIYIIRKNTLPPFKGYSYNIIHEQYSLLEIKGNKFPVGIYINNELPPFSNHTLNLMKGDSVYIFSDGFADQFGGEFGKKFKYNQLKELLISMQDLPFNEQHAMLNAAFLKWRGSLEQVDDVLIIGFKVV